MKTYLQHKTQKIQVFDQHNSLTFPYLGSDGRSGVITAIIVEEWDCSNLPKYKPKHVEIIKGRFCPDYFTDIDNLRVYNHNRVLGWYIEDQCSLIDLANDLIKLQKE